MQDTTVEKKFFALKKKLDALHYTQPFGLDSAHLVERLFSDLIKVTEAFQDLKRTNESLMATSSKAEQALKPLQAEISMLSKENNALHYEMIKVKENSDNNSNRWRVAQRSLEGDKRDLNFMIQQKDANYRKLEEDVYISIFVVLIL